MKLTIDVQQVEPAIHLTSLAMDDLELLGKPIHQQGAVSVVLLSDHPQPINGQLTFEHTKVTLLNLGSSASTVVITTPAIPHATAPLPHGDSQFRSELPPGLRDVGNLLLDQVRRRWAGELGLTQTPRKYVERPDNFWTVKIQPRVGTLALTVRGEPHELSPFSALVLKADQAGYSRFQIRSTDEVDDVIALMEHVPRR
jgi:hypothetical protein